MKSALLFISSVLYIVYYMVFYDVVKTNASVMQLDDSDVSYSIGSSWANGNQMAHTAFILSVVIFLFITVRYFLKKKGDTK